MSRTTRAFVDAVEEGIATLLVGERTVRVPAALLPDGAGEGAWVEITVAVVDAPDETRAAEAKRRALDRGSGE